MSGLLVCGSRTGFTEQEVRARLDKVVCMFDFVVHGGASGVDSYAEKWCVDHKVPTTVIRPKSVDNKIDYLFRNCVMIGMCEAVLAFWDGESKGTKFTIDYAKHYGLNILSFKPEASLCQ